MALKSSPSKKKSAESHKKPETNKNKSLGKEETNPGSTKQFENSRSKSSHKQKNSDTNLVSSSFPPSTSRQCQIYSSQRPLQPYDYSLTLPHPGNSVMPYYPPFTNPSCYYPVTNDWSSLALPGLNPMYSFPVPPVPPVPVSIFSPIFSTACPMLAGQPLFAEPIMPFPQAIPIDMPFFNNSFETVVNYSTDQIVPYQNDCNISFIENRASGDTQSTEDRMKKQDPLEYYLTLPRELFPAARMLRVDPNLIINEFCKEVNIQKHSPWILDLEFGVPSTPVTRPIAIYDVKFNSIHCKNTPGAIHPGFESCSQDFKKVCQFYYDCIISSWYTGYMVMNNDTSVSNFQSWLQPPLQGFGMCWP